MPMHDWTRVEAGIFHAFHHHWISAIGDALNDGKLPADFYALPERIEAGVGPDAMAFQDGGDDVGESWNGIADGTGGGTATALQARPRTPFVAETEASYYRRKKSSVVVRHSSGDRVVAMLEIVSPGNKSNQHAFRAFVEKACELLERHIHLLIVDSFPPGPRDPHGIHAAIWEQIEDDSYQPPADQPLTLVAYECDLLTRAYIEPAAIGQPLPAMPLFLEPNGCVMVPLEETYTTAFAVMPQRWRSVLAAD